MLELNDKRIIKLIKKQDEAGIKLLLQTYGGLMKSVARRHLYDLDSHVDECINDALLAIWHNIEDFDHAQSSFKNWMLTVTRFKAIDLLRKHAKERDNTTFDEAHQVVYEDKHETLWQSEWAVLIKDLDEKDQQLLTLIYVEGYSAEEAAQIMQTNRNNVYNRISRAKKRLRRYKNEQNI